MRLTNPDIAFVLEQCEARDDPRDNALRMALTDLADARKLIEDTKSVLQRLYRGDDGDNLIALTLDAIYRYEGGSV